MKPNKELSLKIRKDMLLSMLIYAAPVLFMFAWLKLTGQKPWLSYTFRALPKQSPNIIRQVFENLQSWGLPLIMLFVGILEFAFGLYKKAWNRNEMILDIVCFSLPRIIIRPGVVYFTLQLLPTLLPTLKNTFGWVPFWWGFLIIAVADDLTQYWYHRLHHQIPWLWRFHRTHHSANYMGMAMASRQNVIYTIFFSQIYFTATLTYLGLGLPALFVGGIKSLITTAAHSSIPWDKPFYRYKFLQPVAWIMERLISTPATHHAHHADTTDDGIGYYKGNFGNMFFLWDIIFGTGIITRKYPSGYGIRHYQQEEWYAQFLWPVFKSQKSGSELAADGPVVSEEVVKYTPGYSA